MDWRYTLKLATSTINDEVLDTLFKKLSDNLPNTYVFTKNIAESMVNDYKNALPVIIYRPSIVIAAEKEPLPGFIDNFNGILTEIYFFSPSDVTYFNLKDH